MNPPTPDPEINALLRALLAGVREALGEWFIGLYVHGSLAIGGFEPGRSDIDFLVVTTDELPEALLRALAAMHARLTATGGVWARRLEGSYIPQHALRRYDPARALHPALRTGGSFGVDQHGVDWIIQRHVLRKWGLTLAGPDPKMLIDPVPPEDLHRAARGILREWWAPMLTDPTRLRDAEYQVYAILTMCRVLYTFEHGAVVDKPSAARWALGMLGERWAGLIARALAWRHGKPLDELDEALALIREVRARVERSRGEDTMSSTEETIGTFLERYGAALGSGDLPTIVSCWEVPALVLGDGQARAVNATEEIETFFGAAVEWYHAQGQMATRPELIRIELLGQRLASVDVRWAAINQAGEVQSVEYSRYLLTLDADGAPRIRVAIKLAISGR